MDAITNYRISKPKFCKNILQNNLFSLKILQQNIRSISKNFDEFLLQLDNIGTSFHILILTECWISKNYVPKMLKDYDHHSTSIHTKQNDGVIVYTRSDLTGLSVNELQVSGANCLQINLNNDTCILAIYRSPSSYNISSFLKSVNNYLTDLCNIKNCIISGDLNINILPTNEHPQCQEYLNMLSYHGFQSTINAPTRVTSDSISCIDHFMVKSYYPITTILYESTLTDHYTTILAVQTSNRKDNHKNTINIKKINYDETLHSLRSKSWSELYDITNPEDAWTYFINYLQTTISQQTNIIAKYIPNKILPIKPWINHTIINSIRKRNKLHKKVINNPFDIQLLNYYKRYRNICTQIIRKAKEIYYKQKIENCNNDPKKIWKTLKEATHSQPNPVNDLKQLNINDKIIHFSSNPNIIVNHANKYFSKIGEELAKNIGDSSSNSSTQDCNPNRQNNLHFSIKPISNDDTRTIINSLKNSSSTGLDDISNITLKKLAPEITIPLTNLINLSILKGHFPDKLKHGIIIPIHKGGSRMDITNYRPITLLNSLSKVLEKAINNQLIEYLESNNILSHNQFGFRKNKGTSEAVATVTDFLVENLDKRSKCMSIFLDLCKAFDTISHSKLLQKLSNIGINGNELSIFRNYLTNRKQSVKINECLSNQLTISFGVPQGSVLGPTLFLIYINELCNLSIDAKIVSFADDTILLFKSSNWNGIYLKANRGIAIVKRWLDNNTLTMNVTKTKYIEFSINASLSIPVNQIKICACPLTNVNICDCPNLERVTKIKYLGIIFDSNLKWKEHIITTANKLRKSIYFFRQTRNFLNLNQLKTIYYALCQSLIEYGIIAWGGANAAAIDPIFKAQKLIIKIILKLPFTSSSDEIFRRICVLDIRQIYAKNILAYLFKHRTTFENVQTSRDTRTKGNNLLLIPFAKTTFGQRHFRYFATKLYNTLPLAIRQNTMYLKYKSDTKSWIINQKRSKIKDFFKTNS